MNDTFHSDHDALVAYLYDECEPAERDAVAAHLAQCASCADEIDALRATRRLLSAWAPPEAPLGFQITRTPDPQPAVVLPFDGRTAPPDRAWWRQPLPAWAQVAAAAVIFAAGLAVGNGTIREATPVVLAPSANPAPVTARTVSDVTRADLAGLEQRLLAVERGQSRQVSPAAASSVDADAMLARVQSIVDASEERQRRENLAIQTNIATLADYVRGFDAQRRADLRLVENRLERFQGATGAELQDQRDALSYFVRTSFSGAAGR
jgi:hypothetical protein